MTIIDLKNLANFELGGTNDSYNALAKIYKNKLFLLENFADELENMLTDKLNGMIINDFKNYIQYFQNLAPHTTYDAETIRDCFEPMFAEYGSVIDDSTFILLYFICFNSVTVNSNKPIFEFKIDGKGVSIFKIINVPDDPDDLDIIEPGTSLQDPLNDTNVFDLVKLDNAKFVCKDLRQFRIYKNKLYHFNFADNAFDLITQNRIDQGYISSEFSIAAIMKLALMNTILPYVEFNAESFRNTFNTIYSVNKLPNITYKPLTDAEFVCVLFAMKFVVGDGVYDADTNPFGDVPLFSIKYDYFSDTYIAKLLVDFNSGLVSDVIVKL